MFAILTLIACSAGYRILRPTPILTAKRDEDFVARLIAVLSLVALPVVGVIVVSYGMDAAMSAGTGAYGMEKVVKFIVFIPGALGCVALARAHSWMTLACALPAVIVYFIPALQKNLCL